MEKRNNVSGPGKKTTASRCSLFKGRKTTYNEKGTLREPSLKGIANRREDREERGAPSDGGWGDRAEEP